jgi:ribosomal protein S3
MEAFNLFNQLNYIKNEIDEDLGRLRILQKDLQLRSVNDNNKELEDRVRLLDSEYFRRDEESKKIRDELKIQVIRCEEVIGNKDREIYLLNEKMKELMQDNKVFEINLNTLKSKIKLNFFKNIVKFIFLFFR